MNFVKLKKSPIAAGLVTAGLSLFSVGLMAKSMGPQLQAKLALAEATDTFEVVVSFEGSGGASAQQIELLEQAGVIGGVSLNSLPMVGTVATKSQIEQLYQETQIRSIWHNSALSLENDGATQITGVDRLRADESMRINGMPYSGRGIGVVVNDSGVDGTHSDILFPNHVTQNVLAQTNLHSLSEILPITYQENVANTDIAGGHGSHVAGIIGGNGAMSSGKYQGVAPGAKIVGYGSGAGLFILDTLGGFDYALTHQYDYGIRVISNSFGSTGDMGSDFNPDHPTNIATKALSDNGVVVVFSAGNSGNGESTITGNFKKAPWVITVAAGDKSGKLADFSSRGVKDKSGTVVVDGETYTWVDAPTITAPGVDIISTRASLSSLSALSIADDSEVMAANHVPYYTSMSGTSMAAPHISGVVALMLEANPNMNWRDVKSILMSTATNMPGRESWEVGAGYVNAHAAVKAVVDDSLKFGTTTKHNRTFNANAQTSVQDEFETQVPFSPVGDNEGISIEVQPDASMLMIKATVSDNTLGLSLFSPSGKRYGSGIALPAIGENIGITAPAEPGTWTLKANGIGGISGVDVDPIGVTNGYAAPGNIPVSVKIIKTDGFSGLHDIESHPAKAFVELAVSERLVDAKANGFQPDAKMKRLELADFLALGAGVRQSPDGSTAKFLDINSSNAGLVNAVSTPGGALKDLSHSQQPMITSIGDHFEPNGNVSRSELAYALVQALALQTQAQIAPEQLTAIYGEQRIAIADHASIPTHLKGYVQLALDLGLLNAYFDFEQSPYDLEPTIIANFFGHAEVSRADYAVAATRLLTRFE